MFKSDMSDGDGNGELLTESLLLKFNPICRDHDKDAAKLILYEMQVDEILPDEYEWYEDQIAGHHPSVVKNGLRQIGIIKEKAQPHLLLKLIQEGLRGESEVGLYEKLSCLSNDNNVSDPNKLLIKNLERLLPQYYGTKRIQIGHRAHDFIQLEDITYPFEKPCIMDVKIGRVTYDPMASEEKKLAESSKCPFQKECGFRILGYRLHPEFDGKIRVKDKNWGRTRTLENMKDGNLFLLVMTGACTDAYVEYLQGRTTDEERLKIVELFIEQLQRVKEWFDTQEIVHFYASSLLFVYEGSSHREIKIDLRMIDFSHVFYVNEGKDMNYIQGLDYILNIFLQIRADLING